MIAASAAALTSCLGSGKNEQSITYNYTDCFNTVTDLETGKTDIRISPAYTIFFDYIESTADISMSNISLPGINGSLSFKLEGLKFSFDKTGAYVINAKDVTPMLSGENYTFNNFNLKYLDRVMNDGLGVRMPIYYIRFTINDRYEVNVVGKNVYYFGTTQVLSADETSFSTYETYYKIELDPQENNAYIRFYSAKFAQAMPTSLNFTLRQVPFTVDTNGFTIKADGPITPYINDQTPNPSYDITDLDINVNTYNGGSMSFSCNPAMMGQFGVTATLDWMTPVITAE
ncbi:MAG: hypothetical protein NC098_04435 [Lachnoclostridium sp.]|nr:hypothetical protein [Lachnoclostridium sp.]